MPFMQNLGGWHFLILLIIILLVFGAAKLPALAKSLGQSARVFKGEMKAMKAENGTDAASAGDSGSPAKPAPATAPEDTATIVPPTPSTTPPAAENSGRTAP